MNPWKFVALTIGLLFAPTQVWAETLLIGFEARITNVDSEYLAQVAAGETFQGRFSLVADHVWDNGLIWGYSWEIHDAEFENAPWTFQQESFDGALHVLGPLLPPGELPLLYYDQQIELLFGAAINAGSGFENTHPMTDFGDLTFLDGSVKGWLIPFPVMTIHFQPRVGSGARVDTPEDLLDRLSDWEISGAIGPQSFLDLAGHGPLARFEVTSLFAIPEPASFSLLVIGALLARVRFRRSRF